METELEMLRKRVAELEAELAAQKNAIPLPVADEEDWEASYDEWEESASHWSDDSDWYSSNC